MWLVLPLVLFPVVAPWLLLQDAHQLPYLLDSDFTYHDFESYSLPCIDAARRLAHETKLACRSVVGKGTSQFIWDEYQGPNPIALPVECQVAARVILNPAAATQNNDHRADTTTTTTNTTTMQFTTTTMGGGQVVDDGQEDAPVDWNLHQAPKPKEAQHSENMNDDDSYTMFHSFRLSKEECSIEFLDSKGESQGISVRLMGGFLQHQQQQQQQERMDNVLGHFFDEASAKMEHLLSNINLPLLFENRLGIAMVVGGIVICLVTLLEIMLVAIQLVLLTLVLRLVLPKRQKDHLIGMNQVSFWSTWQAFVLLTSLTETKSGLFGDKTFVIMAIPAVAALYYHEHKAALEWTFLGVLSYGFESTHPFLDRLAAATETVDALGIVHGVASWVGMLIPGEGWNKLVRLYFYIAAYPPVRCCVTRWWQGSSRPRSRKGSPTMVSSNDNVEEMQAPSASEPVDESPKDGNVTGETAPAVVE